MINYTEEVGHAYVHATYFSYELIGYTNIGTGGVEWGRVNIWMALKGL